MAASVTPPVRIDRALVARLIRAQFPQWAGLPITPVEPGGWDNRTFRLGSRLSVRLPSAAHYAEKVAVEQRWLPRLAPHLPLPIPAPVAQGQPGEGYPWPWSVYEWLEGESVDQAQGVDPVRLALDLAGFLNRLRAVPPMDGPQPGAHNFWRGGWVG
jgi:aminoglycoside phosphotransferase (APT) family kinase protein